MLSFSLNGSFQNTWVSPSPPAISPSLKEQRSPKWRDSATSTGGKPEYFIKDGQTKLVILPMPSADDAKVLTGTISNDGLAYAADEAVTQLSTTGSGTGFAIKVLTVDTSGEVLSFEITDGCKDIMLAML